MCSFSERLATMFQEWDIRLPSREDLVHGQTIIRLTERCLWQDAICIGGFSLLTLSDDESSFNASLANGQVLLSNQESIPVDKILKPDSAKGPHDIYVMMRR